MGPPDPGAPSPPEPPPGRPYLPPPDIFVLPPQGPYPLSRGARERRLERVDHYDRRAKLAHRETLTPTGTLRLSFDVLDDEPFEFRPGYFVGIQTELPGVGVRRSPYCIVSPPDGGRSFDLLVRLVPEGPVSCHLCQLELGDTIKFRGPSGRSMIPKEGGTELVLLATGVGVGPLLSLARHLLSKGFDRRISLYWGLRLAEDVCLLDELDDLSRSHPEFTYRISLSRPPRRWSGLRGRLTESVPPLLGTLGGKHFYLVGNGAMIEEFHSALSDLGVDKQLLYHETYFNVRYRPAPEALEALRARFVAQDLFAPLAHQEAGLFIPELPPSKRARRLGR